VSLAADFKGLLGVSCIRRQWGDDLTVEAPCAWRGKDCVGVQVENHA
jgi:hypothetical protein